MIFISYRHSDGKAAAKLLKDKLCERGFLSSDIFLDLYDILGENHADLCYRQIHACDCFILMITEDSFRQQAEHDYYLDEIHQALEEGKKIVPILYETTFDIKKIPEELQKQKLHLLNAIRYDLEYENDSMNKITRAVKNSLPRNKVFPIEIASWFAIPLVFISIYILVSFVGGVVRYVWDNYWLSDDMCEYIASSRVQRGEDDIYYYITHDSIYVYDKYKDSILVYDNAYFGSNDGIPIIISQSGIAEAGFWTLAVGMVYEISKFHYKLHGNSKVIAVVIAVTVSIVAGFGMGFVCERMLFPVHESRIIRNKLHSLVWWDRMTNSNKLPPSINKKF